MRETGSSRFLAAGATLVLGVILGCQVPPGPDLVKGNPNASTCPNVNALRNFQTDTRVAAGFSNNGSITTYFFASLENENPVDGVPGLIKYCVYPDPAAEPTAIEVQAKGANGDPWSSSTGPTAFSFGRPNGNPSNIPLDGTNANGTSTVMGTATWGEVPTDQSILLHINDPTVCANLYPNDDPGSCFVLPGEALACVLDHGETNVAYNAMPFGAADCPGASLGFEATGTTEFGDEVLLDDNVPGRDLVSLKVLFSSWACVSGHWFSNDCTTSAGDSFPQEITANIYDATKCPGTLCVPIATVMQTFKVPYRPSADNTKCIGTDQGKWFNPVAGACKNQISIVLTFNFPDGTTLPNDVIWTVAFNTTHYGTQPPHGPWGESAPCFTGLGGCPYDSFNVGAQTFDGAPYAGTDFAVGDAWGRGPAIDFPGSDLAPAHGWDSFKPLGEIITK